MPDARAHPFAAKLTGTTAEDIRRLHRNGTPVKELARRYGVAKSSVSAILHLHVYVPEHVVMVPLAPFERGLLAEIARDENIGEEQLPPGMGHCVDGSDCCALGALFVESHAMGLLTFGLNVTLDGCIDHTQGIADDELHDYWTQLMDQSGAMLFGRNTYELMEGAWPAVARDEKAPRAMREWAQKLEAKAKYVVSGSRSDFPWQNTIKVEGDLREAIAALKAKTERGVLVGAPKLAAALEELGLIDEYRIVVHPIISGRGPTLFHGLSSARHLELLSTQRFKSGVQALHFRRKAG